MPALMVALLLVVYYLGGRAVLNDSSVAAISHAAAVWIGVGAIVGGLLLWSSAINPAIVLADQYHAFSHTVQLQFSFLANYGSPIVAACPPLEGLG